MQTELPEVATPTEPKVWKKVNSITIAFGHGMSTTPLQTAVGAAALMNGGRLMPPTFLPRTEEQAAAVATQVLNPQTSEDMRYSVDVVRCVGACGGRGVQGGGSADTARNPSPGSAGGDDGTGRYALMVRKLLERRGAYPGTARRLGLEGLVRMTVTVDADGSILDTEIERSSGFRELDQAALASARDVSGLPPPPERPAPEGS